MVRRTLTDIRVRHSGCVHHPEPSPTVAWNPHLLPPTNHRLVAPPCGSLSETLQNPCTYWNSVSDHVRCRMALRVLIADDSLSMRLLLQRVLTSRGHQVYEAVDGDEALQLLHTHQPDIAILDVIMPGLDGLEVSRAARAAPDLASIKIIVISANATAADALAAGADRFLVKPFLPSRLLTVIDELTTVKSA